MVPFSLLRVRYIPFLYEPKNTVIAVFLFKKELYLKNNNILFSNSVSKMIFLAVEQTYLHYNTMQIFYCQSWRPIYWAEQLSELHTFYFILIGLIGFTTKKEGQSEDQRRHDTLVSCAKFNLLLNRKSASIYRYLMRVTLSNFQCFTKPITAFMDD